GKTRVITEKIAHLIATGRVAAKHIAAITFTNKAAKEMRERVARRIKGDAAEGLTVCTFHSLGLKILQIEHATAGLRRGFSVFDADDSAAQIRDLLPKGTDRDTLESVKALISRAKNEGLDPEGAAAVAQSPREREAADIYGHYQRRLSAFNAVDFDDLIRLPLKLLEENAELAGGWRERRRYLLVDEYQDTNGAQYRLLKALAGPKANFTCVGDDDQSIYAWRGADPENIMRLGRDFPQLKVITLEQNYRCARRILRAANAVIANNPHEHPKQLWSDHDDGPPIRVVECDNNEQEAERVAAEIAFQQERDKRPWHDFAILFRGNHQSKPLEKALQMLRVPYHLSGGTAFLDRGEVKDAMAWLRLIANPDDDAAFLRAVGAPRREIGQTTLARLSELAGQLHLSLGRAAERTDVVSRLSSRPGAALDGFTRLVHELRSQAGRLTAAELYRQVIEHSGLLPALRAEHGESPGYHRRRENLEELANWLDGERASPGDLVAQLSLLSHADRDNPGNTVRLMSLHAAKGLEFHAVFMVGVEDGLLPHQASLDEGRLEEERRLMYVGMTRAKRLLQISHSRRARRYGELVRLEPSRFLAELPDAEVHRIGDNSEQDQSEKQVRAETHMARIAAMLGGDAG
ncbi:MAG: UvrD-helicase domain-containing protein, partial [Xanthomonadales bacterium]|nr:UvrD-helicase domain-containing protein [Xanthomonadales bacterium]